MVFSIIAFDITISCRSFVFSQSRAKVSAGLTKVSDLAVAAFDLCIVLFVCVLRSVLMALTLVGTCSRRIGLCATRMSYGCRKRSTVSFRGLR